MDYNPSSLVYLKAKKKWYVQVTKPIELQNGSDKQVRRSTGTCDRKEAEKRQHCITEKLYREFDEEIVRQNPQRKVTFSFDPGPADPLLMFREKPVKPMANASLRLSRILPSYIDERKWKRDKSKIGVEQHIKEFISVVGDLQIDQLKKSHAYQYARYLHQEGYAKSTVGTRVRAVGTMLTWCEKHYIIQDHRFRGLELSDYGFTGQKWKAFTRNDSKKIFSQELPDQERLCMTLLATTGARLDEIALLRWDQIVTEDNITYLDLTESLTKNAGSKRLLPLHARLRLPADSDGRVFNYAVGQDVKSQGAASKAMMPFIRSAVSQDDRKVLHSFRGTFKDMMRDAGVPKELNDFITGHGSGDVAGGYGAGHSLRTRYEAVNLLDISFVGPVHLQP